MSAMEEKIKKHREFLVDRIDPEFGLLDKLLASRTLTREDAQKIKLNINTTCEKNRILLDLILNNKKANELVSALRDNGQTHLVNYLNADGDYRSSFGDDWPLTDSEINRLEINRESLVDLLDTRDLCIRLFSMDVINNRQKQLIYSKPTDSEKSEALLDILTKCSFRHYKQTIACLKDSNQKHVAELLSEGGVVVRVHANLEGAVGNVDEMEDKIISQLTKVLENRPLDEATRLLELTHQRIIAARKGQSIVLYIHGMTHEELLQLIDLLKTGRLKDIVERVFTVLLSIGVAPRVTLVWSLDEFTKAATYFETRKFDELNDKLERLQKERAATSLGDVGLTEQLEDIRSAESTVSYKNDPILIKTIRTKAAKKYRKGICGLAISDTELFMASFQNNDIEVYDLKNLTFICSWSLDPLTDPYDVAYCNINKYLYIMDLTYLEPPQKIFRIDRNGKLLNHWTTGKGYGCISVTYDCNVVMVAYESHTITEYKTDGEIVREIKLSIKAGFSHPRYAIKLTNDRFLISHGEGDDSLHRVCLVDIIGNIIMSFGGPSGSAPDRLYTPIYMTIDSSGSVFVVDRDNSRVLALTSGLEFMREIISSKREGMQRPERMVIDQANGRLLVAHNDVYWSECRVFVFQIL